MLNHNYKWGYGIMVITLTRHVSNASSILTIPASMHKQYTYRFDHRTVVVQLPVKEDTRVQLPLVKPAQMAELADA